MKKLQYIFKTNDQELENNELNYIFQNNIISFIHKEEKYQFDIAKKQMIKTNKEGNIKIDIDTNIIEMNVHKVGVLNIPIVKPFFKYEDNQLTLKYTLENDEKITNEINIIFIDKT